MSRLPRNTLSLTNEQTFFLRVIEDRPNISSVELMTIFGISRGAIYDRISFMKRLQLITEKVVNKKGLKGYSVIKKKRVWK